MFKPAAQRTVKLMLTPTVIEVVRHGQVVRALPTPHPGVAS